MATQELAVSFLTVQEILTAMTVVLAVMILNPLVVLTAPGHTLDMTATVSARMEQKHQSTVETAFVTHVLQASGAMQNVLEMANVSRMKTVTHFACVIPDGAVTYAMFQDALGLVRIAVGMETVTPVLESASAILDGLGKVVSCLIALGSQTAMEMDSVCQQKIQ